MQTKFEAELITTPEVNTDNPGFTERRSFLGVGIGLIASSIAAVLGLTIGRYTLAPALSAAAIDAADWIDVGLLAEIPDDTPVKRSVVVSQDAGWGRFNAQRLVWVLKKDAIVTVFSATCPHLGCTINKATNGFICPCHGSAWNPQGQKLGGPTPRGMDTVDHRVEGGVLKIRYQYFKQGTAEKEAVS